MKSESLHFRYIEWKTPDEMHFTSLQWKSKLDFINDENRFFEDMLKEYMMPIVKSPLFSKIQDLVGQLSQSKEVLKGLNETVNEHSRRLSRLIDNVDQPKEARLYRQEHKRIMKELNQFLKKYKRLKREVFENVSLALKQQKQKRLIA